MQLSMVAGLGLAMSLIAGLFTSVSAQVPPFKYDLGVKWIDCGPSYEYKWADLKLHCDAECQFGEYDHGHGSMHWYVTITDLKDPRKPVYITVWFKTWDNYDFLNTDTMIFHKASYSMSGFYAKNQTVSTSNRHRCTN